MSYKPLLVCAAMSLLNALGAPACFGDDSFAQVYQQYKTRIAGDSRQLQSLRQTIASIQPNTLTGQKQFGQIAQVKGDLNGIQGQVGKAAADTQKAKQKIEDQVLKISNSPDFPGKMEQLDKLDAAAQAATKKLGQLDELKDAATQALQQGDQAQQEAQGKVGNPKSPDAAATSAADPKNAVKAAAQDASAKAASADAVKNAAAKEPVPDRVKDTGLKTGMQGKDVLTAQQRLNKALGGHIAEDGDQENGGFGRETRAAVKQFQRQAHLPVTGKIDEATWNALRDGSSNTEALAAKPAAASPSDNLPVSSSKRSGAPSVLDANGHRVALNPDNAVMARPTEYHKVNEKDYIARQKLIEEGRAEGKSQRQVLKEIKGFSQEQWAQKRDAALSRIKDFSAYRTASVRGIKDGLVNKAFLGAMNQEGTGTSLDNRTFNQDHKDSRGRNYFAELSSSKFANGKGTGDAPLIPYHTFAADMGAGRLAPGTWVYVPELEGKVLANGAKFNGVGQIGDTGGAFEGQGNGRADVYLGEDPHFGKQSEYARYLDDHSKEKIHFYPLPAGFKAAPDITPGTQLAVTDSPRTKSNDSNYASN